MECYLLLLLSLANTRVSSYNDLIIARLEQKSPRYFTLRPISIFHYCSQIQHRRISDRPVVKVFKPFFSRTPPGHQCLLKSWNIFCEKLMRHPIIHLKYLLIMKNKILLLLLTFRDMDLSIGLKPTQ